jgi:hypothetical protein
MQMTGESRPAVARVRWWLALADVVGIPAIILLFIWRWQFTHPRIWIVFPIWLAASFLLHRDTPKTLGWRADNLGPASREAGIFFAMVYVVLLLAGARFHGSWEIPWSLLSLRHLWNYFAFCLLQQVALNSFLNNRMITLIPRPWLSSLATGGIFAAAHWPNPVLVPLTFVGGVAMAWLFERHRNILPLAVGQAIAGTLLGWSFPAAWHHNLRVGPGYYLWKG